MGLFDGIGKKAGNVLGGYFGGLYGLAAGNKYGTEFDEKYGGEGGGDPYGGMPGGYPSYIGMSNEDTQVPVEWDMRAQDRFNTDALRSGPSASTRNALDMNASAVDQSKSNARGMATGLANDARSQLAMKGGIDSGASERIAKSGISNALDLTQQAEAGANTNRGNILMQDEAQRQSGLQAAAGMNANSAKGIFDMRNANKKNLMGSLDSRNAYNMNLYNQNMAAWGAGKQATATENSGKK